MTHTPTPQTQPRGASPGSPTGHRFDYYYRAGMPLRPAPPRATVSELWRTPRQRNFSPWMAWSEVPADNRLTCLQADHMWQGDERMDAVVNAFRRIGAAQGRRLLVQALDHGIDSVVDPPRELVDLFADLDNPPPWYDPQLWERGRRIWINASFAAKLGMMMEDFLATFVGVEVSSATGATGRFVHDFARRTLEQNTWFWNATRENAMDRHSPVFKDTVRLRLMHAQVRAGLRRSWGDEHFNHHGNPISNATMMGAAVSFGLVPLLTDHAHGRTCTADDLDAVMMYWKYIAHVLGVADELIPASAAEAIVIGDYVIATAGGPSEWTPQMAQAATSGLHDPRGLSGMVNTVAATAFLGVLSYYGGEPLVRALVRDTPLQNANLTIASTLTGVLVATNVGLRRFLDHLPFAEQRMNRLARGGDHFWQLTVKVAVFLARRKGITETPYAHHDVTPDTPAGCPVHRPA